MSKDLVSEKEGIKSNNNNKKNNTKMKNFQDVTKENIKKHNRNLPHILEYPYKILITGRSRSRKSNSLFNLKTQQPNTDKIYL